MFVISTLGKGCRLFSVSVKTFENVEQIATKQASLFSPNRKVDICGASAHSILAALPMPIAGANAKMASLALSLPLGSRSEHTNFQGYAHFLQAMAFKVCNDAVLSFSRQKIFPRWFYCAWLNPAAAI